MRVNNVADKKDGLEGEQEDVVMGIDADNHLTLLNSLTHLYANPVLAALREYVANASDSHKGNGSTKPIEIDYPFSKDSTNTRNLRIRDYGDGMTREQLTRIYSQYGATTKGNNNNQVGGFGLGSKSGLAVSSYFFVTTVSNGMRVEATVLRNEDNTSVIRILSEKPTKELSGTEIILPLTGKQLVELRKRAEAELVGYKSEEILINSSFLEKSIHNKEQFIPVTVGSNVVAYIERNPQSGPQSYYESSSPVQKPFPLDFQRRINYAIVMGGVYYRTMPTEGSMPTTAEFRKVFAELTDRLGNSPRVILNVPVGSVNLPPHRDSIIDTEKTWNALSQLMMNLKMGLDESLQAYLNEREMDQAAPVVASMDGLFAPDFVWIHRGTKFNNDLSQCLSAQPYLFRYKSPYPGRTRAEEAVNFNVFPALYGRGTGRFASYYSYNSTPDPMRILHVQLPEEHYNELVRYEANSQLPHKTREKLPTPRFNRFITQFVAPIVFKEHAVTDIYVMATPENVTMPGHFAPAFDEVITMAEIKVKFRKLFPPKPKVAVQQNHCRIEYDKLSYSLISSDENIVYFGGKGQYLNSANQISDIKKISIGFLPDAIRTSWVQDGLLGLVSAETSLVAVAHTRSIDAFKKSFPDATPMGKLVMDAYNSLDGDGQLAVKHAYSIISEWHSCTDELFEAMKHQTFALSDPSINYMFWEPKIAGIAWYLHGFMDSKSEGYEDWKKEFIAEVKKERDQLASQLLLPIYSLLGKVRYFNHNTNLHPSYLKRTVSSEVVNEIGTSDIAGFIDRLTR